MSVIIWLLYNYNHMNIVHIGNYNVLPLSQIELEFPNISCGVITKKHLTPYAILGNTGFILGQRKYNFGKLVSLIVLVTCFSIS